MVDSCLSTAAFCVCSALIAVVLRQYCREQSLLASLAACGGIMAGMLAFAAPAAEQIRDIFTDAGVPESYLSLIFKAAAVCFITQITCELCRDCGESAIASAAELWGRAALTLMAIPLVRALTERISELLEGVCC